MSTPDEINIYLKSAEKHFRDGLLPSPSYYKILVTLASELLDNCGDQDRALEVLNQCPPEYFVDDIVKQMREDYAFSETMLEFCYFLNRYGILGHEPEPATQGPAEA